MTDPLPAPVARAIDAVNAGDSDAFLTEFASDGWIDDNGRRFVGLVAVIVGDQAAAARRQSRNEPSPPARLETAGWPRRQTTPASDPLATPRCNA